MFDGELFAEFLVLYRLLHVSRYEIPDGAAPSACRMERWRTEAIEAGTRALDQLRDGVQNAIAYLGTGFLRHPANTQLRDDLDTDLFKRALLRLVYRLLFWFVAEDRDVLLNPGAAEHARNRYEKYFSSKRLREVAVRRAGTTHGDLWQVVGLVLRGLGDENGLPQLGLPGLGGIYDDTGTDQILHGLELSNEHLLAAIKSLARVHDPSTKRYRPVDYRNLGAEELGSIYESLLELVPKWSKEERRFLLDVMPGNERKSTGSYYTPTSLIDCLLDTTLDPVLDEAQKRAETAATAAGEEPATAAVADALLSVTVCDPACGSGHFLVAAARRIAKRLAAVRERNPEPTLEALRTALRDVVTHCIYGVDINPMAVELAKVSLWLEALEPGKPLGFLDARIKCGNALIGATPALIGGRHSGRRVQARRGRRQGVGVVTPQGQRQGQPAAGRAVRGPGHLLPVEQEACRSARTDHRARLRFPPRRTPPGHRLPRLGRIPGIPPGPPGRRRLVRRLHMDQDQGGTPGCRQPGLPGATRAGRRRDPTGQQHGDRAASRRVRLLPLAPGVPRHLPRARQPGSGRRPSHRLVRRLHLRPREPPMGQGRNSRTRSTSAWLNRRLLSCLGRHGTRDRRVAERESRRGCTVSERTTQAQIHVAVRHQFRAYFHYALKGSRSGASTKLQMDQLFAERFSAIVSPKGRLGCIIPTAIATGAGGQYLFGDFTRRAAVVSLYDFENLSKRFFSGGHASQKFCLLSLAGKALREPAARFAFFLLDTADLDDADRVFAFAPEEIAILSPNTGSLPIFRTRRDADLTLAIYSRMPVLWEETKHSDNPWNISFVYLFRSANDRDLFRTREQLYAEGWELHGNIFTRGQENNDAALRGEDGGFLQPSRRRRRQEPHGRQPSESAALPHRGRPSEPSATGRTNVLGAEEARLIPTRRKGKDVEVPGVAARLHEAEWDRDWLCGWCDVTASTNERSAIPAFIPRTATAGNTYPLMFPQRRHLHSSRLSSPLRVRWSSTSQPSEDQRRPHEALHLEAAARPHASHAGTPHRLRHPARPGTRLHRL